MDFFKGNCLLPTEGMKQSDNNEKEDQSCQDEVI